MKRYNMILFGLLSIVFTSFFASCEKDGEMAKDNKEWVLVWSDEFDTPTSNNRPDPSKWTYEKGNSGFGNNELQNYTSREENVHYTTYKGVSCLAITALNDNYNNVQYSSARIKTEGLFEIRYGRIEARLLLPYGPGLWPAFWMLGSDYSENPWPACGEIDIMENKGYQPNIVSSALHMPGRYSGNPVTKTFGFQDNRFDVDFHVFAIEWDKEKIDFYVDDVLYNRVKAIDVTDGEWVFDHPFFIILNVAVGGTFGGNPTSETVFPQTMYIDYVRAYKKNEDTLVEVTPPSGDVEDPDANPDGSGDNPGSGDNHGGGDNPDEEISSDGTINDWDHDDEDKGSINTDAQ